MTRKESSKFTTIGIRKTTRSRLKSFGIKGELYDDIVNKLMDFYEENSEHESSRR